MNSVPGPTHRLPPSTPPLRIVAIGGGTGLSSLLHGLKKYVCSSKERGLPSPIDITAVVTVTDDGGSSGRLRRELDVLPPGDIRNCLVALSQDETLLSQLFQYRFENGRGLKGHSFGNLFLSALTALTGDFAQAVRFSSEILASCGKIYPSTSANVSLVGTLEDGTRIAGESRLGKSAKPIRQVHLKPRRCEPLPETLQAIAEADLICLGPGSLFTSVIPNLLVSGISPAIQRSAGVVAYFVNLMWQPGETMQYRASDHVEAIHRHAKCRMINYAIVNTKPVASSTRRRYAAERAQQVENDYDNLKAKGVEVVRLDLLADSEKVRHNPDVAAAVAIELAEQGRMRRTQTGRLAASQ